MGRGRNASEDVNLGEHRRRTRAASRGPHDADALAEKRRRSREQLKQAVSELRSSEGWIRWLNVRSKFRRYSLNNQFLIAIQRPDATQIAGFKTWKSLERSVRKGEKAIKILAPRIAKKTVTDADTGVEREEQVRYFVPVSVFDVAQTDGKPLPKHPYQPLTGESHAEWLPKLAAYAAGLGYAMSEEQLREGVGGFCDPVAKRIVLNANRAQNAKVATAIHEIAHAHGIDYTDYTRPQAEVIVESVAYMVCQSVGLEADASAVPYLADWDDTDDLDALTRFAGTVDELANKIETGIGVASEGHDTSHRDAERSALREHRAPESAVRIFASSDYSGESKAEPQLRALKRGQRRVIENVMVERRANGDYAVWTGKGWDANLASPGVAQQSIESERRRRRALVEETARNVNQAMEERA
jgi:antirestriction protein ArdC